VPCGKDRLEQLVVGTVPRPGADRRGVKSAAVRSRRSKRRALRRVGGTASLNDHFKFELAFTAEAAGGAPKRKAHKATGATADCPADLLQRLRAHAQAVNRQQHIAAPDGAALRGGAQIYAASNDLHGRRGTARLALQLEADTGQRGHFTPPVVRPCPGPSNGRHNGAGAFSAYAPR
jgi:hypothetical protein